MINQTFNSYYLEMSNIWKVIRWFCNWYFGRDDYEDKVIVYETDTAICCKYLDNDNLTVANFKSEEEKNQYIGKWMSEDF